MGLNEANPASSSALRLYISRLSVVAQFEGAKARKHRQCLPRGKSWKNHCISHTWNSMKPRNMESQSDAR